MLTLNERGLIFCKDTVLARANASGQIDFDFHVNRCQKLLTVAYGNNPAETTLLRIATAIETWNQGLHGRAVMKLIHIGLPEPERDDAWNDRLAKAERQIDDESIRNASMHWQLQPRQPKGSPDITGGEWAILTATRLLSMRGMTVRYVFTELARIHPRPIGLLALSEMDTPPARGMTRMGL